MSRLPNVLLLVVDSGRWDRIGCTAIEPSPMPALSGLMANGRQFTQAFSNGNKTQFAMPSLFSSTYPLDHGGYDEGVTHRPDVLPERLAEADFETVAFSNTAVVRRDAGYARGVDQFFHFTDIVQLMQVFSLREVFPAGETKYRPTPRSLDEIMERLRVQIPKFLETMIEEIEVRRSYPDFMFSGILPHKREILDFYETNIISWLRDFTDDPEDCFSRIYSEPRSTDPFWQPDPRLVATPYNASSHHVVSTFLDWLGQRQHPDRPFWAYLHLLEVHDGVSSTLDCVPSAAEVKDEIVGRDAFRSEALRAGARYHGILDHDLRLRLIDIKIRRLLQRLTEIGVADQTLFVVTADHGVANRARPVRGQVDIVDFVDDTIHVPLAFVHPDIDPYQSDRLCSHVDVAPSILDFLGLPVPDSFKGRPLLNPIGEPPPYVLTEGTGRGLCDIAGKNIYLSIRSKDRKIQYLNRPDQPDGAGSLSSLVDLRTDPEERSNLATRGTVTGEVARMSRAAALRCQRLRTENQPAGQSG